MPVAGLVKQHRDRLFLHRRGLSLRRKAPATGDDTMWFDLRALANCCYAAPGVAENHIEWLAAVPCTPQSLGSFRRRTHFRQRKTFQYSWIMREEA